MPEGKLPLPKADVRPGGWLDLLRLIGPMAAFTAVGALLVPLTPASAKPIPNTAPEVGTVDTLAGPGFCDGVTGVDQKSDRTAALGLDPSGTVFVGTGASGAVRKADQTASLSIETGVPSDGDVADPLSRGSRLPSASRLAVDGKGGAMLAAGARVIHLDFNNPSITTLAGDPAVAPASLGISSGDGGPAALARFRSARSIATDGSGFYVADSIDEKAGTFRIRFINTSSAQVKLFPGTSQEITVAPGHIDTVAGANGGTNAGDGGPARLAVLQGVPPSMAVSQGRLYLGLYWRMPGAAAPVAGVRMINLGGAPITAHGVTVGPGDIETVAEGTDTGPRPGKSTASTDRFSYLPGIAADPQGNLFFADPFHQRIKKLDATGAVTTFAGSGKATRDGGGFNGNGRPALETRLNRPYDVKVGPDGQVYISDQNNGQVRTVDSAGVMHAAFGNGRRWTCQSAPSSHPQSQPQTRAGRPARLGADATGNVYFVNKDGGGVMQVGASGGLPQVRPVMTRPGGVVADPSAVAVGLPDRLYVLDREGRAYLQNLGSRPLRAYGTVIQPGWLRPVAGGGQAPAKDPKAKTAPSRLGGQAPAASDPFGGDLVGDRRGNLIIADHSGHRVLIVNPAGKVSTLPGAGPAEAARTCCSRPVGLAIDASQNIYISDIDASTVWFLNRSNRPVRVHNQEVPSGTVRPVAGNGTFGVGGEGVAIETPLASPVGIAVDRRGNLYIAESGDHTIRKVGPDGRISTVAGIGRAGFNGDGLPGKFTSLTSPTGVAVDQCGNVLFTDSGNDRVRRLNLAPPCLATQARVRRGMEAKSSSRAWPKILAVLIVGAAAGVLAGRWRHRRG